MKAFHVVAGLALALVSTAAMAADQQPFANFKAVGSAPYDVAYDDATRTLYSAPNATAAAGGQPGPVLVDFDFMQDQPLLNAIGTVRALFSLTAVSNGAAGRDANTGVISQAGFNGNAAVTGTALTPGFSFTSASAFTAGGTTYAAGTNLLTATFSNAVLTGSGASGSFTADSANPNITQLVSYQSSILDFTGTADRSFSFSLNPITPGASGHKFDMFSALVGGTLSANRGPTVHTPGAVPEPASWATMLVGFGVAGAVMRAGRRRRALFA